MRSKLLVLVALTVALAGCGSSHPAPPSFGGSVHPPGWGKPAPPTALQRSILPSAATATMYDSILVSTVPTDPFALGGYVGGRWRTFLAMRRTWPRAHTLSIAISSVEHADCLDVEPGDAPPSLVVVWVRVELRLGWPHPCVYSDWFEYTHEILWRLRAAGLLSVVLKWDADYTFVAHIDPGFDATQYTDRAFGRNLDASLVFRSFLRVAHPPLAPRPKPRPKQSRAQRELHSLIATREQVRRHLIRAHCRVKRPRRACHPLFRHGDRVKAHVRALEARGVR